jgi:hypothetical protein
LSPAQDGSSPLSYFRALAALSLWGGLLFAPGIGGDRGLNHNELLGSLPPFKRGKTTERDIVRPNVRLFMLAIHVAQEARRAQLRRDSHTAARRRCRQTHSTTRAIAPSSGRQNYRDAGPPAQTSPAPSFTRQTSRQIVETLGN